MFATFVFGLRCFADFDKGLQASKLHGQSYKPVATTDKDAYFGDCIHPLDITAKPPYSPTTPLNTDGEAAEPSAYSGGTQLGQRMSIE